MDGSTWIVSAILGKSKSGGEYFIYKIKPNFILQKSASTGSDLVWFGLVLTNMHVNLACQTSFSLAFLGDVFSITQTWVQILSKNYLHFYPQNYEP